MTGALDVCCAVYGAPGAELLFGESMHPGGVGLTERAARLARLGPGARVLDAGCGLGTSALLLAERFGCDVTGVDASEANVRKSEERARRSPARDRVRFVARDLTALDGGAYDAALAECVCSTLDGARGLDALGRALVPGGTLLLSDVVGRGEVPSALQGRLGAALCLANAPSEDELRRLLDDTGFAPLVFEDHTDALVAYAREVRRRLPLVQAAAFLSRWEGDVDLDELRAVGEAAQAAIDEGRFGYVLVVARLRARRPRAVGACAHG